MLEQSREANFGLRICMWAGLSMSVFSLGCNEKQPLLHASPLTVYAKFKSEQNILKFLDGLVYPLKLNSDTDFVWPKEPKLNRLQTSRFFRQYKSDKVSTMRSVSGLYLKISCAQHFTDVVGHPLIMGVGQLDSTKRPLLYAGLRFSGKYKPLHLFEGPTPGMLGRWIIESSPELQDDTLLRRLVAMDDTIHERLILNIEKQYGRSIRGK
jgi:hypothetical protein